MILDREQQSRAIVDTLRMTDRELLRVLARMAERATARDGAPEIDGAEGAPPRALARIAGDISGGGTLFLVRPHTLSTKGAAFLLGVFIYPGARVALMMREAGGQSKQFTGVVRSCEHVDGRLHEVRMTFDSSGETSAEKASDAGHAA